MSITRNQSLGAVPRRRRGFSRLVNHSTDSMRKVSGCETSALANRTRRGNHWRTAPLFLQVKEAGASVLEAYAGKSIYPNHGQRVVNGCRLMQSASDLFLGWTVGPAGRQFYVRQLKDMKIKVLVELFTRSVMTEYAELCGWTLEVVREGTSSS